MSNFKITPTVFGQRPDFPKPNPEFMKAIGGEKGMQELFDKFYDMVSQSDIAHFFPQDEEEMNEVKKRNTLYFIEFFGGAKKYSSLAGKSMDVIDMHIGFSITEKARWAWLGVVEDLLQDLDIDDNLKQGFWDTFESFSKWTVNRDTIVKSYEDLVKL
ncbi:globin [Sulfurimonas sp.]|uniref:globin domain-containing protein n=1 Tax=Sulfurimonas sp. TaxID=2022749 RepID=UPI002B4A5188|nr:globin [Sulfurimonas sp.]